MDSPTMETAAKPRDAPPLMVVETPGEAEAASEGAEEEEEVVEEEEDEESATVRAAQEAEKAEAEAAVAREKAAQKQILAIEELVYTERNYLRNLQLITVTIRSNLQKIQPALANLEAMFLHIEEVMDVSGRLLSLLDQTPSSDPNFLHCLCDAFLSLTADIEMAYKEYLANYNNVTAQENSYKQKEALWNEMVKVIKTSAPEVNATSLTFFLVMPVQRIARYPMLLQMIQKHTDPSHPAYSVLQESARAAVDINCRINEYKRFREVADKYKKTEVLTIKDMINRLNGHSIAKKTARLSQHIKHETGMVPKLKDEEFDALEGFFYVLEKGIVDLHDNVTAYLGHLQKFIECRPDEHDLDMDGEKAAVCYKEITAGLRQWIYPAYERRLSTLVFRPLNALRDLLPGPRNLIRKRLHKLLDYELLEEKASLSYEEQAVAGAYRTINALLLAELPLFNSSALQLLWGVLGAFSCLLRDLSSEVEQLTAAYSQQLPHSYLEPSAFWGWAGGSVLEGAKRLESLCQSMEEEMNAPIVQPLSPSSQKRLKSLTEKHGSGKIYQLSGHVVGSRDLDLTLQRGELVAVLSEMDTRGDRRRWLVDTGGPRGYAPSSKLVRYHQATADPPPSPSPHYTAMGGGAEPRRHSYTPESHQVMAMPMPLPCFQVFAGYDFRARSSHEVSLQAGEPVRVLERHDKRGNPQWSLVEAHGQRGYAPSNYLTVLPSNYLAPPSSAYR
ncbi:rho guanine nucleotide exchange factor 37 isoform X1 [Conger conger]|uniref:rho guanine nucleotide exchange factor 37 isoform X1 n=2 Tax=Conger conger TaxID=82655 RepID=UPI002A59A782|nr:rho guanine nucleotide exchange factor 37 isoform X1 [Conger conger]XP_061092702.1 rho guanine nucleotide exchange factor 37 isoform X1 [Conger conger]XP_061092703.1 rho guanine nucleotide exchange factor 37 isoform X1 [Conger conger]XP_061092704.1 rho guanine nucleotide exchange factor 37 isoform X1 [Conger conger]